MKRFAFLVLVAVIFVGCSDRDDNLDMVHIRIKNESSINYDLVQVGGGEMLHENIGPNEYSGYLAYEMAYEYAYISITAGDGNYVLQPIDFVGETPLENGFYTYGLSITEAGDVILNFSID